MTDLFGFESIVELCKALGYDLSDCSCEKLNVNSTLTSYCDVKKASDSHASDMRRLDTVLAAVTCVAAVLGMTGNGVVIWVRMKKTKEWSRYTQLITSLSVCDFVFALLTIMYR